MLPMMDGWWLVMYICTIHMDLKPACLPTLWHIGLILFIGTNWSCYFLGNINGGWAVLQYMSCWDWVGMKFKMVGMDPNRCHLKPRPATLIRKHPEWMVWLHLVEQQNHGQMEFTNYWVAKGQSAVILVCFSCIGCFSSAVYMYFESICWIYRGPSSISCSF